MTPPPAPSASPTVPAPDSTGISTTLQEKRVFPPPPAHQAGVDRWHIASLDEYKRLHAQSVADVEGFWAEQARALAWFRPWHRTLAWDAPDARWFEGGEVNACYNCLDRHVHDGHGDELALVWEGEPLGPRTSHAAPGSRYALEPEIKRFTYRQLLTQVCKCANTLRELGVEKGDVVTIYMPMVPELAIAMLACARIGAAHSVIFGGFAPQAITERVQDANSKVIITADGGYRRGEVVALQTNVEQAVNALANHGHIVNHVLVLKRTAHVPPSQRFASGSTPAGVHNRGTHFHWWHDTVAKASDACPCERTHSEDLLFLLYTSGSTGKPKGIVHTTAGYLTFVQTTCRLTFNMRPGQGLHWCSADIGWVTGHSYVLYGPMLNRVPTLLYEGAPNYPTLDNGRGERFWDIIARHRVTTFYTAPTAIRTFMKWGDDLPARHDLSSLRILGTVGEPINPEAWIWYHQHIGGGTRPIVDTYWQTETGGHVVTPLPGAIPTKPGSCTLPMLGIDAAVVNEQGRELGPNQGGLFVIRKPWPGMLRGVFGNRERFISNYWGRVKDPTTGVPYYFSADGARRDEDGYFWVQGRIDDVIKVSGHLLGTMEVESALVSHPAVAEAAVVGMPHEIKGSAICAFVTLRPAWLAREKRAPDDSLKKELAAHVAKEVGALARPDQVRFAEGLPKTRSGKIMRRLLRDVAAGVEKITQDTTTLEDFSVVAKLRADEE